MPKAMKRENKVTTKKSAAASKSKSKSKSNGRNTSARRSAAASRAPAKPARQPKKKVLPVPTGYGTATPTLVVSPCADALDFYAKAFGAKVRAKMEGPDGMVMHAEIKIGDSVVMCADEMPPMSGQPDKRKTPKNAGATTGGVMLYVKDVDTLFNRAVAAGGTVNMPLQDMFWGDRYGQIEDPFGHIWSVATHIKDVSAREMKKAMAQMEAPSA
jgi:uncharacterized glyoxalase superfamily protein PhnB